MDRMKKLREKKGMHGKMHPMEQKAKMGVIGDLQKEAESMMGNKLKGLHKVTVASDSDEGLEHGLDKAHDVLKHLPEAIDDSHPDHEGFAHTERSEDGEDGSSDYPDAGAEHDMEKDPMSEHMRDDKEEGEHEPMYAEGGEVDPLDGDAADEGDMPMYDDMDEGEIDRHLKMLTEMKRRKGMA